MECEIWQTENIIMGILEMIAHKDESSCLSEEAKPFCKIYLIITDVAISKPDAGIQSIGRCLW